MPRRRKKTPALPFLALYHWEMDLPAYRHLTCYGRSLLVEFTISLSMEEALLGFEHMPYDLVIADIFMTGMGGIEGIMRMRKARPEVKILATSAGYSDMSPNAALEAAGKIGADAVLPKPFSLNDLRELVTGLIEEDQDGA